MARESTLNVSLTPALRQFVRSKVEAGGYESASEVIRESLRILQERDRTEREFWQKVRRKVGVAKRQVKDRRVVDGEAGMREFISEAGSKPVARRRTTARAR